jgi:hypothetical protein
MSKKELLERARKYAKELDLNDTLMSDKSMEIWLKASEQHKLVRSKPEDEWSGWDTVANEMKLYNKLNITNDIDGKKRFEKLGEMIQVLDSEFEDIFYEINDRFARIHFLIHISNENNIMLYKKVESLESVLASIIEAPPIPISEAAKSMFHGGKRRLTRKRKN